MTLMNIVTAGAITIGAGLVPLHASGPENRVIVTGCAYKADGDGDGQDPGGLDDVHSLPAGDELGL